MAFMWMEPRCSVMAEGCDQTGPGMFAILASVAKKNAISSGWKIVGDEWICPVCLKTEIQRYPGEQPRARTV